ncbi:hypothetical protein [Arthrobacter cryoconiti]|uniref:Uncharacterized protein n=1 Tax=Arthrobacter cryoconiti TaxID=748907 RepID=A0ABV8R6Z5_9MICC|nr:hypothetical protein [Arthrobacter cryoconiti]MCC9069413.1 hypothetical protein [Arthrobacter cryoconiti]
MLPSVPDVERVGDANRVLAGRPEQAHLDRGQLFAGELADVGSLSDDVGISGATRR